MSDRDESVVAVEEKKLCLTIDDPQAFIIHFRGIAQRKFDCISRLRFGSEKIIPKQDGWASQFTAPEFVGKRRSSLQ